ncbi:DUF222 domain-containing protein [Sciscionella sediminilitoris]|uniref:DUF222 domain-containing protein n=1 Tax=Sciscionella sediminilitoris TaxID=1445613 RepID=UPI0009EC8C52|nr:DUF222 domain-containing protein [Sciscionella sp. SE31]
MSTGVDEDSLIEAICVCDRERARLDAMTVDRVYALWCRQKQRFGDLFTVESVIEELRLARNVPRGWSIDTVETTIFLSEHMPGVLECMHAGQVDLFHASKIREVFESFPEELITTADTRITERLQDKGRPRDWVRYLRRLADRLDPAAKEVRIAAARAARYVSFQDDEDGTGTLFARLPSEDLAACETRIDAIARSLRHQGDPRTLDQLRADTITDLITGRNQHTGVRVVVNVQVPLGVALDMSEEYCRVTGYGEIPAHTARAMLTDPRNTVRKILTDPDTGVIRGLGRRRYRPSTRQRDYIRLRDHHCRVPGCCRPIQEIDHAQAWADNGHTNTADLQGLRKLDHKLKSAPGWHYRLDHHTSELEITTPTGRTYRSGTE